MNRLIIPTILTATVLLAGIFALMPVQKASTIHTAILAAIAGVNSNRVVSETVQLGTIDFLFGAPVGLPPGGIVPILDVTTPGEAVEVHIAATLPSASADADCDDGAADAPAGVSVFVGTVPTTLEDVADDMGNSGIEAGFDAVGVLHCVYHITILEGAIIDATTLNPITDVAVLNSSGFPLSLAQITVTAIVKD